ASEEEGPAAFTIHRRRPAAGVYYKPRIHSTEVTMTSRKTLWAGRVMSGFAVLFLLVDATVKVLELPPALEATTQLGYPASVVFGLGVLQLRISSSTSSRAARSSGACSGLTTVPGPAAPTLV